MASKKKLCRHVTYDDLVKYYETDVENFTVDDVNFLESVENRLDNCNICVKRLQAYNIFSIFHNDEKFSELAQEKSITALISISTSKIKDFFAKLIKIPEDRELNSASMHPAFSGARGLGVAGAVVDVIAQKNPKILSETEDYIVFELTEPKKLIFKMPYKETIKERCGLLICGENGDEHFLILEDKVSGYLRAIIKEELKKGRYIAYTGVMKEGFNE